MPTIKIPGVGEVERKYVIAGAAIVVAIAGYAWIRRARSSGEIVMDPADGSLGDGTYSNPAPRSGSGGVVDDGASEVVDTNHEWASRAADSLAASGFEKSFVVIVLGKYLSGVPLTPQEADVARSAIAIAGPPPDGAPPITIVEKEQEAPKSEQPKPEQPKPEQPKALTYTVKPGDTLSKIGTLYGVSWTSIYSANRDTIEAEARRRGLQSSNNGHWIFPGTVLTIPK